MWLIIGAVILFFVIRHFSNRRAYQNEENKTLNEKTATGEISSKRMMTENEIHLYEKLKILLPHHIIFSQVSFSAFLSSKDYATRATFNRKIVDFVILDQQYNIACLIELDDNSHRNKAEKDRQRDEMCYKAGYAVIRFPSQPNIEQMKDKLAFLLKDKTITDNNLQQLNQRSI